MRPCVETPFTVRGLEFGGAKPLFCVPLVAADLRDLVAQAGVAHELGADLIEWRADFYQDGTINSFIDSLLALRNILRDEPIIFTLRIKVEGGAQEVPQETRRACIEAVIASGLVDLVDVELCNGTEFLSSVQRIAAEYGVRAILSFHDFEKTPTNEELLEKISLMNNHGADVAKIAVMPQTAGDVLRLLEITSQARQRFPRMALCTMSMARLGILSRIAGFLFGSDMAFGAGQASSAPGQIPVAEARAVAEKLLKYACPDS
jgi:3-dehydroquinate dehydratase-1